VEIKDFTDAEKLILTLAVKSIGSPFTVTTIINNIKITKKEAERIINGLISKGIAAKNEKNKSLGEPSYDFKYGLRDNNFIDMEAETNKYWEEYEMELRGRVCP